MTRYLVEEQSDMTAKKKVRTMCGVQYISYKQVQYSSRPSSTKIKHPHQSHLVSSQRESVNWWLETISCQDLFVTICVDWRESALSHICRLDCGGDCGQDGGFAFGRKCTQNTCIGYDIIQIYSVYDVVCSGHAFRAPDILSLKSQREWRRQKIFKN